jgi:hypothetical protein
LSEKWPESWLLELIDVSKLSLASEQERSTEKPEEKMNRGVGELAEEMAATVQENGPGKGVRNKSSRMKSTSSYQAKTYKTSLHHSSFLQHEQGTSSGSVFWDEWPCGQASTLSLS